MKFETIIGSELKSIYEGKNEYEFITSDGFKVYVKADSFDEARDKYIEWSKDC